MPTITAAGVSQAEVQAAIDSAASGDTVAVPAGSATWAGTVLVGGKAITLQGAGIGQTNITDGTTSAALGLTPTLTNFIRLTGFTFIQSGSHSTSGIVYVDGTPADGAAAFRIDHCRFLIANAVVRGIYAYKGYGVIDHCVFDITATAGSLQTISINGSDEGSVGGYDAWLRPLTLGSINAVYIEDNVFNYTTQIAGTEDCIDAYAGARLVVRHNTFVNCTVGFHGTDSGSSRGTHSFEVYQNSFLNNSGVSLRAGTVRGGTGVFYGNTYGGSGPGWYPIALMCYRACPGLAHGNWGQCDGTLWKLNSAVLSDNGSRTCNAAGTVGFNTIDKETLGTFGGSYQRYFDGPAANGYPGRDQPGITTGQVSSPIYVWSNGGQGCGSYDGGSPPPGGIEAWVQTGRDYFSTASTPKPGYTAYVYPHALVGPPTGGGGGGGAGGSAPLIGTGYMTVDPFKAPTKPANQNELLSVGISTDPAFAYAVQQNIGLFPSAWEGDNATLDAIWIIAKAYKTPPTAPTLSSLSPNTAPAGSAAFVMTLTGTNFQPGLTVIFGTVTETRVLVASSTSATVTIYPAYIPLAGTIQVSVKNGGGAAASGNVAFTVT